MSDLIKREDAAYKVEVMLTLFRMSKDIRDEAIDLFINSIPAVEPKVGKWERKPYKRQEHEEVVVEGYSWRCSNCGDARQRNEPDMNFCPNCGAKMEREKERASERLLKCGQELKERLSKI